jgi:hypothetical protein
MKPISLATLQHKRWGCDLDGVLAVKPPPSPKPWSRMNGPERRAQRDATLEWYRIAEPLGLPDTRPVVIVSARKNTPEIRECSCTWLQCFPIWGFVPLCLLDVGRTIKNVAKFKVSCLEDHLAEAFVEDNRAVLKAMAALRPNCTLYFWDKDSPAVPELVYSPFL